MANISTINIGNLVNDGTGDDLRTAFNKVNQNFASLNNAITVTAANIGQTGVGLYKDKNGSVLEFKNLVPGNNIQLVSTDNSIVINNAASAAFNKIDTISGSISALAYPEITVQGVTNQTTNLANIDVTAFGSTLKIDTMVPITQIVTSFDFGPVASNFQYVEQLTLAFSNIDFGTITNPAASSLDVGHIAS